jgi:hypothetical protein
MKLDRPASRLGIEHRLSIPEQALDHGDAARAYRFWPP